MTDKEKWLWYELREFKHQGHYFRRQVPIGKYVADFACLKAKLIVELDGSHHGNPIQEAHDIKRDKWLESEGFRVLRFWNDDLKTNKQVMIDIICEALPLEGGGGLCEAKVGGGDFAVNGRNR